MIKCTWCEKEFDGEYKMEVYGGHTTGNPICKNCWKKYTPIQKEGYCFQES